MSLSVIVGHCGTVGFVSVRVSLRLPEALVERISVRAGLEGRSLSNMIERLLGLGVGVVSDGSCSRLLFHGANECPECGWKPSVVSEPVRELVVVSPVASVPVREVREHGWRGADPKPGKR